MDGAGPQERGSVRCVASGMIKSEVSGDAGMWVQASDHHSCNSITSTTPADSKTTKIKQIVEDAISPDSKQTVLRILDQVNELSTAEKLLLYLKLPTGKSSSVDPLRQPLNPLGSRFEIHQTITWIKTHLEEDPDVSLPKQDVYDEYIAYCNNNAMKPLSTADFGKVMKQVFPRVRPRRLGTRGNSRYCYAGMRKRMKLEAPILPDLGEETKPSGNSCSEDELVSAATCLICEWAQKLLGVTFKNLCDLACHLVENLCVDSRSVAAFTILSACKTSPSLSPSKLCAGKATSSLGLQVLPPGGAASKHRETQLQLQRKLQEREVIREQKRKLQEQTAALTKRSQIPEKGKGKRAKLNVKESTNEVTQGAEEVPPQAICDKGKVGRGRGSRRPCRPQQAPDTTNGQENGFKPSCHPEAKPSLKRSHSANCADEATTSMPCYLNTASTNKPPTTFSPVQELNLNVAKRPTNEPPKLPIPRLSNTIKAPNKQLANVIIFPPMLQQPKSPKKKYKPIQPKPEDEKPQKTVSIGCLEKDALDDYLHGGNNSQEQEEELMRYFQHQSSSSSNEDPECTIVEGSKSDKLSQLRLLLEKNLNQAPGTRPFKPNAPPETPTTEDLADRNGDVFLPNPPGPASVSLSLLSQRNQNRGTDKPALLLPSLLSNGSSHTGLGSRRRVSFETSVMEQHYQDAVPPSPNTRRRIFSFTPISPGPHSPLGPQRASSKPSSANASPFVSPRNTPVPRSRHNSGQTAVPYLATHQVQNGGTLPRVRHATVAAKVVRSNSVNSSTVAQYRAMSRPVQSSEPSNMFAVPGELHLPVAGTRQPISAPPMSPLSISAPQSPMIAFQQNSTTANLEQSLLQEVLQSVTSNPPTLANQLNTTTVPLKVDPLSQEVSQFFPDDLAPVQLQYRSQSVPLHRMTSALVSPQQGNTTTSAFNFSNFASSTASSVAPTPVPSEFTDFVGDAGTSTDLLMVNGDSETPELNSENLNRIFNLLDDVEQQKGLTLDIDAAQQNNQKFLFQPSRSYPNTPLPYQATNNTRDPVVASFSTSLPTDVANPTSRSYPSTPLMGLPMFGSSEDDAPFQQGLGDMGDGTTTNQLTLNALNIRNVGAPTFAARRNINALLEQPPFPVDEELALDTLALQECDSFTQFVQEVSSTDT